MDWILGWQWARIRKLDSMTVLFISPAPFYQERGTPIAIDRILRVLSERGERVDVLTNHLGRNVDYPNVTIHRTAALPFIRNIRPGFSWNKVLCDVLILAKAIRLVLRKRPHLVHAVEEAVFIAVALRGFFRIPYVYDMDSSIPDKLVEQYSWLRHFWHVFMYLVGRAVRHAEAVVPVCDAIAAVIEKYEPKKVLVLPDFSLLDRAEPGAVEDLRLRLGIGGLLMMYVGNLEIYQGIDLLLDSYAVLLRQPDSADLVVIGGDPAGIVRYQQKSRDLGIAERVHFIGPRPVEHLSAYLSQADILVSPRIRGSNTPMKIYSYLDSGKPVAATDLPTHTQVLTAEVAVLSGPTPEEFAGGIRRLVEDAALRARLGQAGRRLIAEKYNEAVFRDRVNELYDWLERKAAGPGSR
ncbi:MAG: glycosyltransferase [Acidobacteriota bacterium]